MVIMNIVLVAWFDILGLFYYLAYIWKYKAILGNYSVHLSTNQVEQWDDIIQDSELHIFEFTSVYHLSEVLDKLKHSSVLVI